MIEPQDAYARYIPQPGYVTVEVRDPAHAGIAGRIGKWKFDSIETAAMMKKTLFGRGIHLRLPWPGDPPEHERLLLSVRYTVPGAKPLESDLTLRLNSLAPAFAAEQGRTKSSTSRLNRTDRIALTPDR